MVSAQEAGRQEEADKSRVAAAAAAMKRESPEHEVEEVRPNDDGFGAALWHDHSNTIARLVSSTH